MRTRSAKAVLFSLLFLIFGLTSFGENISISYSAGDGCSGSVSGTGLQTFNAPNCQGATLFSMTTVGAAGSLSSVRLYLKSEGSQNTQPYKSAEVRITDTITIRGGAGSGTLVWNWNLDGKLEAGFLSQSVIYLQPQIGNAFGQVAFVACGANAAVFACPGAGSQLLVHNANFSLNIPFVYDAPLSVNWLLQAGVSAACVNFNSCTSGISGTGTVDFYNTVEVQPLLVLDSSGNQVQGATVLSDSGYSYAIAATDTTPPLITPHFAGTLGANGWYRSNVTVSWSVIDPESGIASSSGCTATTLTADTPGTTLTCSATNGAGLSMGVPVTVKIDKTPPVTSGLPAPGCTLWPPNHKMVQVATVTASDGRSGLASFNVNGSSNEASHPEEVDIVFTGNGLQPRVVQLRADRSGAGTGRIYTLTAIAVDQAGNTTTSTATCTVPRDQGQN